MDSKTRIAIVLVAVILGVNLVLSSRSQKRRMELGRARADSLAAAAAARPAASPAPVADVARPSAPAEPAVDAAADAWFAPAGAEAGHVVIETPLQELRIARAGGVVDALVLQLYTMADTDQRIDLIARTSGAEPQRALGLQLRTSAGVVDLSAARFDPVQPVEPSVRLAAGAEPYEISLRAAARDGGAVVKTFRIDPDSYGFEVAIGLERGGRLQNVDSYAVEWTTTLPVTEANQGDDLHSFRVSAAIGDGIERRGLGQFKKPDAVAHVGDVRWSCMQSKYFLVALIPAEPRSGSVEFLGYNAQRWLGMRFVQPTPWRSGVEAYRVYAGPIQYEALRDLNVGLEANVELGWSWIRPLSSLLLASMHLLHRVVPNYGVVILILSVLTKLAFWPLTEKSFRSMRQMQSMQPVMEELKRRYKNEPQELNRQMMAMYRDRKVNPLGGCLPIVIQMPIFFALYSVLRSSIDLRNAAFVGWIDNLAGPDVLARLPGSLPVIGNHLSLLPLLMGASMIWQAKLGGAMPASGPAAQQQFLMKWVMPIVMTFVFYKMPSGLVLYWIVNTVMSIFQQAQINRRVGPSVPAAAAVAPERTSDAAANRTDGPDAGGSPAARPGRAGRQPV